MEVQYYQCKYAEFSDDNTFECGNCNEKFYMGNKYPEDTFCCSHCYYKYHGEECPFACEECLDDEID